MGELDFSGAMDICNGGGGVGDGDDDTLTDEDNPWEFRGVPGPKPWEFCDLSGEMEGFLGGAPTTRNMSQTFVLSGNSLTG